MTGLNIHLYPSNLSSDSRLLRLSRSLSGVRGIAETHVVGRGAIGLERCEMVAPSVYLVRLNSTSLLGRVRKGVLGKAAATADWYRAVYRCYSRRSCVTIAAHSVWVLPLAGALATKTGAKLVYNPHEFETGTPNMFGLRKQIAYRIERVFIPRCAVMSCVNESIADLYEASYGRRPTIVRNIPSREDRSSDVDLKDVLAIDRERRLFVHSGNVTRGRNIGLVLDVFERRPDLGDIVFVGDGALAAEIDARAEKCVNIHRLPAVSPSQVVGTVASADVSLCLIELESVSYICSSPNKLFEGISAGLPVICSNLPEARLVLGEGNSGWLLNDPAKDLEEFLGSISHESIAAFTRELPEIGDWEGEVEPLVVEYEDAVRSATGFVS